MADAATLAAELCAADWADYGKALDAIHALALGDDSIVPTRDELICLFRLLGDAAAARAARLVPAG